MPNGSIRVANWERWQSYRKDRGPPPWIKIHRIVLRNTEWLQLTDAEKGHLVSIWILAADKDGEIPDCPRIIQKACGLDSPPDVVKFTELGFLVAPPRGQRDANVTPERRQRDANVTHQSRREEIRVEKSRTEQTHLARAHETPSPVDRHKARFEHTDDFERFKAVYPKRSGSQPWRKAMDAATARLKEGHDFAAMIAGAERYHRYTDAIGDTGTKFVMQAATFLGPEKHFTEPWDPPKSSSPPQRSSTGRFWDNLREVARETNQ